MCTRCLCKPEEGVESLGTGVRGGCDQSRGCGESTKVLAFTGNAREAGNVHQAGLPFQRKRWIPQQRGRRVAGGRETEDTSRTVHRIF